MMADSRLPFDVLVSFCATLFRASGVSDNHAVTTARRLVEADLRGHTGHGLIRVVSYLERIAAGGINIRPAMRLRDEAPGSAQIDADNGLGQVAMTWATEVAATKARETGISVVGTTHSNHAGAAGLYTAMLAEQNLVGLYFAVANANGMPPWGGVEPILGTNPIAVAVPSAHGPPFLLDIATTATSHGTIKVAQQSGNPMPVGWVVDVDGEPITDPDRADEGVLVPIGGHKGSGLTVAIGLLAGVLNGAAFGRSVVDHRIDTVTPTNTGQLLIALQLDVFRPVQDVLADVAAHLQELRSSGSRDSSAVRLPGDRAAELREENLRLGIPVPPPVLERLNEAAMRVDVAPVVPS